MKATFDRKFGAEFVADLPTTPAVYLFRNQAGVVIYVGKAVNVRRRIASYRNASRRKAHRKQRKIIRAAASLEVRHVDTEQRALLLENELIRTLRPALNIEGKYDFLYPLIGVARTDHTTLYGFTTHPDEFSHLDLQWYGCFRSRLRAKEAFDALMELLGLVGHYERVRDAPRVRGSRTCGFRQLDSELVVGIGELLAGENDKALRALTLALLDKPRARREANEVQQRLEILAAFFRTDLRPLHRVLRAADRSTTYVSQAERDALFLASG